MKPWLSKSINFSILSLLLLVGLWQYRNARQLKTRNLIVHQLQEIGQLHTVIFTTESLVPTQAERTMGTLVVGRTELLYLARGEVRAGIDLQQLQPEQIKQSSEGLEIILPPPVILDSKIDIQRSQVQYYNRGFLGLGPDLAPELQSHAQRRALRSIVATACQQGILNQANLKTQALVTQLLEKTGHQNFIITTQKPQACLTSLLQN